MKDLERGYKKEIHSGGSLAFDLRDRIVNSLDDYVDVGPAGFYLSFVAEGIPPYSSLCPDYVEMCKERGVIPDSKFKFLYRPEEDGFVLRRAGTNLQEKHDEDSEGHKERLEVITDQAFPSQVHVQEFESKHSGTFGKFQEKFLEGRLLENGYRTFTGSIYLTGTEKPGSLSGRMNKPTSVINFINRVDPKEGVIEVRLNEGQEEIRDWIDELVKEYEPAR